MELDKIKGSFRNGYGDAFKEYIIKDLDYIIECIKFKIKFNIRPSRVNVTDIHSPGAKAHTDAWPASLNLYFNASGGEDITTFYERQNDNQIDVGAVKRFNETDLIPIATFTANQGDCYLLNTFIPHSVELKQPNDVRTILRFTWLDTSFEEVLKSIQLLG